MLNKLRNLTNTLFAKILIILIILSFASWGIGDLFRSQITNHIAKIDNFKVSPEYLDYRTDIITREYQDRYRQYFSREAEINKEAMKIMALKQIIKEQLIKAEANDLGYKTNQIMAFSLLKKNNLFLDKEGKFDQNKLKLYIQQNNLNEKHIFANITKDIISNILEQAFNNQSFNFDKFYKLQNDFINQERVIKLVAINAPHNLSYNINPSESELLDFYSYNKDNYLIAKNHNFELAQINCNAFIDQVTISNAEIKNQFDKNLTLYQTPETRYIKQISADSEEKINQLYQKLENGIKFDQVALSNGMESKDINLGLYSKDQLYQSFTQPIFLLKLNSYSKPVKGPFKWHIFNVKKINKAKQNSFLSVKQNIGKTLTNDKACMMAENVFKEIQTNISDINNLTEITKKYNLNLQKFAKINLQEKIKIKPLTAREIKLIKQEIANKIPLNKVEIITLKEDSHIIYNISNINEARHPNIDEIRGLITLDWQKEQQKKLHKDIAEKIQSKLSITSSFSELKKLSNNHPLKINNITISRNSDQLPAIFNQEIFNLKLQQISQPFYNKDKNQYLIAILQNYKTNNHSKGKNFFILEQIKNNFMQNFTSSINNSYFNYLTQKHKVEYNNQLADNIANQNN